MEYLLAFAVLCFYIDYRLLLVVSSFAVLYAIGGFTLISVMVILFLLSL